MPSSVTKPLIMADVIYALSDNKAKIKVLNIVVEIIKFKSNGRSQLYLDLSVMKDVGYDIQFNFSEL